tara:strand:- start:19291 stop:19509 length:219 start_codon:yes stop_codon:yes gene_type:complete
MDKKELGALHEAIAKELLSRINSGEASSGELNVARQFLRDNGIDANTTQSKPLLNLTKVLPFDPEQDIEESA